ncbi:hypothetical protein [Grimontia marina]|uniref:Uncharacterized protein n=1 Tax=Grimontia marina TaxID=646534 RepID=A0A128FJP7_9GAMM|nr:hypothetical protein [Grimontia marina]CZF87013.1 hypothetical protein GMA8713_05054 [Grimontia marina]
MKTNFLSKLGLVKKQEKLKDEDPLVLNFITPSYPLVKLSQEHKGQAYYLFFLISKSELPRLLTTLDIRDSSQCHKKLLINFSLYEDFSGYVVSLTCNEKSIIESILNLKLSPPLPHHSFPDIDPNNYGSLQGNLDLWFSHFWSTYWLSLSEAEKDKVQLTNDWEEFTELRF